MSDELKKGFEDVELCYRLFQSDGYWFEVAPDRDGLGTIDISFRNKHADPPLTAIYIRPEQAHDLCAAIEAVAESMEE